MLGIAV